MVIIDRLADSFVNLIERDVQYLETLALVRANAEGRVWLVGGAVFRRIASTITGLRPWQSDYDFIIERPVPALSF